MPRVGALSLPIPAPDDAEITRRVRALNADLVVLPEAALPGYHHVREDASARARALDLPVVIGFLDGVGSAAGVHAGGQFVTYRKRFLAPAEARVWQAGPDAVVVDTPVGRVGLLICADVLQLQAWEDLRGRVDLVAVCAAWPHYRDRRAPPGLGWLYAGSPVYRDEHLGRCARSLGVPVVFANAHSPAYDGICTIWDANGIAVATGGSIVSDVSPGEPGPPLRHRGRWAIFAPIYRGAARCSVALTSFRNRASSSSSGCHCTPTQNSAVGSATASTTPSGARPITTKGPGSSTA